MGMLRFSSLYYKRWSVAYATNDYFAPHRVRNIVKYMSVFLFVCPLAYFENPTGNFTKSLRMFKLPMAVARSSFGGVAIRYVLPVFWMTSRFHTTGSMTRHVNCEAMRA